MLVRGFPPPEERGGISNRDEKNTRRKMKIIRLVYYDFCNFSSTDQNA